MSAKNTGGQLSWSWKEFLAELDGMLRESLELHCIGGFALVHFFVFPRTSTGLLIEGVADCRNQLFGSGSVSRCRDQASIHPLQNKLAHLRQLHVGAIEQLYAELCFLPILSIKRQQIITQLVHTCWRR